MTSGLILKNEGKSTTEIMTPPKTDKQTVTIPTANIPEEIIFLALSISLYAIAPTRLFLIPFPIPKSKFKNHIKTESNVYQRPSILVFPEKYLINKGVVIKETIIDNPFTVNAPITLFAIILVFSLSILNMEEEI